MRVNISSLLCLALGTSVLKAQHVPGAYIVELEDDSSVDGFYESLGVDVEHRLDLRHRLFNGVSFQVNTTMEWQHAESERFMIKARSTKAVKNIWPVRTVKLRSGEVEYPNDASSQSWTASAASSSTKKRQSEEETEDTFTTHLMTQISKLHAQNITGKGHRIAFVDSGIDYLHPALGGCFGPGCLVEAGWDFVGDDYLPPGIPQPDPDPYDDCEGHGTHVAGIAAAQLAGNEFGFTGAAPGVKLAMYRAWGCRRTSTNEIIMQGFLRAFDDGASIISCSDGDPGGWQDGAWDLVASRIVEAGVPVIISAGNWGDSGLFYADTPASGLGVTAVGAVDNTVVPMLTSAGSYRVTGADVDGFGFLVGAPSAPAQNLTLSLWAVGDNTTSINDACSPLPDDTPDLSDKIVLLRVPDNKLGCYPADQGTNIAAKGGKYMVYYAQSNLTFEEQYIFTSGIEAVITVPPYQGAQWVSQLKQGQNITLSIPGANATGVRLEQLGNDVTGGYTSTFTSWGPTFEMRTKPQFTAPGGKILSTYPLAKGAYAVLSGTSMVAPIIAGIFALLSEVRGTLDPTELTRLLSATSKPLAWNDGTTTYDDILAPVPQQGAGTVQAFDAAYSTLTLDTDSLSFNDSDHFVGTQTFSILNTGAEDVVMELGHAKAATMYYFIPGRDDLFPASFPNPIVDGWAELSFGETSVTVPAGGSANITVTATPPSGLNATLLPVYNGYITMKSTADNTSLSLPYIGLVGSLHDTPVLQASHVYLANYNLPVTDNATYTLPRPDPSSPYLNSTTGDDSATPNVLITADLGTRSLRVDLVAMDSSANNTIPLEATGITIMGSLPGYPLAQAGRQQARVFFKGQLSDGTVVPEGMYRLVVSALRVYGDRDKKEDFDVVECVAFNLRYTDST